MNNDQIQLPRYVKKHLHGKVILGFLRFGDMDIVYWICITSGLSATPSSLYFKTRLAKHCSPSLSCLSTLAEIATVRINSHRNVHEQNYIKLACDTVPARRTTTTRSNDRRDVTNDRARVTDTQPCFESREVEKQYSKNANMLR